MPYIAKKDRKRFDAILSDLEAATQKISAGELNYLLSSVIWRIFENNKSYSKANELMGVLECVKQEFYARKVSPYEREKQEENGDILE